MSDFGRTVYWLGALGALSALGCSDEQERGLDPAVVGMTDDIAPIYDDGEMALYEVKSSVALPVLRPNQADREALWQRRADPFPHYPWITNEDVSVQVSFTLSNLDREAHNVEVLLDPWNQWARYWPGLALVDPDEAEYMPNLSGIDQMFELPGRGDDRGSRVFGTYTFDDMNELAIDFATATNIIETVDPAALGDEEGDPRVTLVNHAFGIQSRSDRAPLTKRYIPKVIPGLTGLDIGLRTTEPANIALEVMIELVDHRGDRIAERDSDDELMPEPREFVTLDGAGAAY